MDMHVRQRLANRPADRQIRLSGEVRMNTTLQTDFGAPAIPGLCRTPRNFSSIQQIRLIAQSLACAAFGKCTKATAIVTNIRVVDVAVDHKGHRITDLNSSLMIGQDTKAQELEAARTADASTTSAGSLRRSVRARPPCPSSAAPGGVVACGRRVNASSIVRKSKKVHPEILLGIQKRIFRQVPCKTVDLGAVLVEATHHNRPDAAQLIDSRGQRRRHDAW